MTVYKKPEGKLTILPDLTVSLELPGILKFEKKTAVDAIQLIKTCVGLSNHEREYLIRTIYLRTDRRPWPFM